VERLLKILRPLSRIVLPRTIAIGVDVQDRHIAFVALKRGLPGGNIEVIWASQQVGEDVVEDGRLVKWTALFEAAKTFLNSIIFSRLSAEPVFILSLPPEHIYTETITLPLASRSEIEKAVELHLETSLPWPRNEAYTDWRVLRRRVDERKIAIFIVAASKEMLDGYLKVFLRGEWRVAACEFHLMSLMRVIVPESAEPFIALLLDEDGAEFAVVEGGEIYAHFLKRGNTADLKDVIPFEIRRFAAWADAEFGFRVSKVYVYDKVGGTERLEHLEAATGISVEAIPVGASLATDPRFIIAAGAARRRLRSTQDDINLVPVGSGGRFNENLILRTFNLWTNILAVFVSIMLIVFAGWLFYLDRSAYIIADEIKQLQRALELQTSYSSDLLKDSAQFNEIISILSKARKYETHYADKLIYFVTEAGRHEVYISNIQASASAGIMQATLRSQTRDNIIAFKRAIEKSGEFLSLDIPTIELLPKTNLEVNAVLKLK
jgi:hypothetical protein